MQEGRARRVTPFYFGRLASPSALKPQGGISAVSPARTVTAIDSPENAVGPPAGRKRTRSRYVPGLTLANVAPPRAAARRSHIGQRQAGNVPAARPLPCGR